MKPGWLPSTGLVRLHHDYATYCTDAPPVYHVASILSAISAACADTAKLIYKGVPHPLNVWVMLLGKSSSDRKTTAARLALDHLEHVTPQRIQRIYGSPEGFTKLLQQEPCSVLYVPEGGSFFGQTSSSYWRHAKGMFMDLYDYTTEFKRKLSHEEIVVHNPRLTILSACALQLLDHHSNLTDWLGGFLPRFLLISGERTEFKASEQADPQRRDLIRTLLDRVYKSPRGVMACSSAAEKILDDFAYEIFNEISDFPDNLHPLLNRLPPTAIRCSALYEIAAQAGQPPAGSTVISAASARCAVALCRASRDYTHRGLAEITEDQGPRRDMTRVESLIRATGVAGIPRQNLFRATRMRKHILDPIIDALLEGELIDIQRARTSTKSGTIYVHVRAKEDAVRQVRNGADDPTAKISIVVIGDEEDIPGDFFSSFDEREDERAEVVAPSEGNDPQPN